MENIILSLLLIKSMTVYELKMFIGKGLTRICSDSLGSVQNAVKKLLSNGCVDVREYRENNLLKKEYSITERGVEQFREWIQIPMNLEKVRNMEEGKFFFLGIAPKDIRIKSIKGYISSLKKEREKLYVTMRTGEQNKEVAVKSNVERIKIDKELSTHLLEASGKTTLDQVVENIYDYQIYSMEYGLKRLEDDICFYEGILQKETEKQE